MVLSIIMLAIALSLLKWAGLPARLLFGAMPYVTLAIVVYSGYEACRRLLSVYDIRFPGERSDEQNHRHRR